MVNENDKNSKQELRLCMDCTFFAEGIALPQCTNHILIEKFGIDLVFGLQQKVSAKAMRSVKYGACGPEGKYWQAKGEPRNADKPDVQSSGGTEGIDGTNGEPRRT